VYLSNTLCLGSAAILKAISESEMYSIDYNDNDNNDDDDDDDDDNNNNNNNSI
jgi:hypothetical protein